MVTHRAELERHLWRAANLLRGQVHSSDYKIFIFGLLFLKRIADRFEEETDSFVSRGIARETAVARPELYEFFVPTAARWDCVAAGGTNLGARLNEAARLVVAANKAYLDGVFDAIDFDDQRMGADSQRDRIWRALLDHFSGLSLRNDDLGDPDVLGHAYEFLVKQFADDSGRKGGEFYTPPEVVRLLVGLLDPRDSMTVYDPTCGSAGMLIEAARHVGLHSGNGANLFGQESLPSTWAMAKMNMLLHGQRRARIELGDTLRDPKLIDDGRVRTFDRVIANPPFSLSNWGRDEARCDRYGRFTYGLAPESKGDLAFVQHMVASTNDLGKVAVVLPLGALSRKGSEAEIRRGLIEDDLVETVIALAENLFYGAFIPASILVLNRSKVPARRGHVLFIDAQDLVETRRSMNRLSATDVTEILRVDARYSAVAGRSAVVPLQDVRSNHFDLTPFAYVEGEKRLPTEGTAWPAIAAMSAAERLRDEAMTRLHAQIEGLGLD